MGAFLADPEAVYRFTGTFFESLRLSGVAHVVISPGSRSTPLSITARHTPGLRTWIELDERAAGFFALGLAKASGRPAVLVCTSGTAAANYLPAVVEAHYSRVPMIVATTDRPAELRDWGAGQTIDQVGLFGGYARWASELPVPEAGEDALRFANQVAARAVEEAVGKPSGAVHLNWPLREPLPPPVGKLSEILTSVQGSRVAPEFSHAREIPRGEDISELAALARNNERGVISVGPMQPSPGLRDAIVGFAEASGWPVLCDPASNLRAGDGSQSTLLLDVADILTRPGRFSERYRPEVVVRLGEPSVSKPQRLWIEAAEPQHVWWLDEGGQWGEPSRLATRVVRGGAAGLLSGAAADLSAVNGPGPSRKSAWRDAFESNNAVARSALDDAAMSPHGFCGLSVATVIARSVPVDGQLFVSNSMSIRLLDLGFAKRESSVRVFCSRGASGIDGITSTALGVAAATGVPTVLMTGDLAFLHDLSGLLLARRETIPLTIVVLDDNGGGIFSMLPVAQQSEEVAFQELFHTPHGLDLAGVAALVGLEDTLATNADELETAIAAGIASPGVSIVRVPVDATENERRFRAATSSALGAVDSEVMS